MATKKQKQAVAKAPWTWRASVAVAVVVVVGLGFGAALTGLLPSGGLFASDRARFHLRLDSAEGLRDAADIANGDDVALNDVGALARVLLWREHGADDSERITAEKLLQKASASARTSPEGLYARALLQALPGPTSPAAEDARLDDELKVARGSAPVFMARALRNPDAGERRALVERAALGKDPTVHATHQLARTALAAGDVPQARAALDRLFRLDARHAAGAITAVVVAIIEDATAGPDQRKRPRKKNEGAPRPGQKEESISLDEARAIELLDDGLDDLDEDQLAITLLAVQLTRSGEVDKDLLERAMQAAPRSSHNAQRLLEIFVSDADADAADAVVKGLKSVDSLGLLVDLSRARFLRALPDDERRAAQKRPRTTTAQGLQLPLGLLAFSFSRPVGVGEIVDAVDLGLPWVAMPDATFFPEKRMRQLIASVERGGARDKLDIRLAVIEKLGLAERASARGDLATALTLLQQARDQVGADADVALVDAALRARQSDVAGVKAALDAAVAAAPDDPRVLLLTARRYIESDNVAGAKKSLAAFRKLGLKSAPASAVEAMIEARGGDVAQARAALAEAKRLNGGDDDVLTLRAGVLVNRSLDPSEARRAADRLLALNDTGGGDVIAVWLAEAAYRKGDQPRAEAALKAILDVKPWIGEGHLFYAQSIAFNPARKKEAFASALKALDKIERGPLVEEAKRLALVLKRKR